MSTERGSIRQLINQTHWAPQVNEWFKQANRCREDKERVNSLAYQVIKLIRPSGLEDKRIWTIKKIRNGLKSHVGQNLANSPESFFDSAAVLVSCELANQHLLQNCRGEPIEHVSGIGSRFKFKSSEGMLVDIGKYALFLGEVAGEGVKEIDMCQKIINYWQKRLGT